MHARAVVAAIALDDLERSGALPPGIEHATLYNARAAERHTARLELAWKTITFRNGYKRLHATRLRMHGCSQTRRPRCLHLRLLIRRRSAKCLASEHLRAIGRKRH